MGAQNQKKNVFLRTLNFALWCNGSTPDSGSVCMGSSPIRATELKSRIA